MSNKNKRDVETITINCFSILGSYSEQSEGTEGYNSAL